MGEQRQDTDLEIYRRAAETATEIDVRFRETTNPEERARLREERDRAFSAFVAARVTLLRSGIITTAADLAEMARIQQQIDQAADTQLLIQAIGRFAGFLLRLAVL
ncbi:hypothetical protein [Ferrovibrio sp.]|uniref:hypothetical protein n=1 Tax=Ferrovibrio sp. TaxID=1917215 RepID=UPI0035AF8FA8